MQLKILIPLFFCTFFSIHLSAATDQLSLSGDVYDGSDSTTLKSALISVYQNDSLIMKSISDNFGHFDCSGLEEGSYLVKIQYIGFETITKRIVVGKEYKADLGKVYLTPHFKFGYSSCITWSYYIVWSQTIHSYTIFPDKVKDCIQPNDVNHMLTSFSSEYIILE